MRLEYGRHFYFMIAVYKITNILGEVYIGSSKQVYKRIRHYKNLNCKAQTKLYKSLLKFGWYNHTFEIIEQCSELDLRIKERYWQEYYNVLENGLNSQYTKTPSKKSVFSLETRVKMSNSLKGKPAKNKGIPLTKEQIKKRTDKQACVYLNTNTYVYYSFKELMKLYNKKPTTLRRYLLKTNYIIKV